MPDDVDVACLWHCDGRLAAVHARPLDARNLVLSFVVVSLVCPPRAPGDVRARPDQRHADACTWRSVPAAQALSLDRVIALATRAAGSQPAPSAGANLAMRLINVHMCVIYFFAGISKLQGESWWTGEAMWRALSNLEYQSIDMTWLAWHPWLLESRCPRVGPVGDLVLRPDLAAPPRPLMLAMAVVLHVGIGACLGMWTFGLIMLVGCASFLPDQAVRGLVGALSLARSRARDGSRAAARCLRYPRSLARPSPGTRAGSPLEQGVILSSLRDRESRPSSSRSQGRLVRWSVRGLFLALGTYPFPWGAAEPGQHFPRRVIGEVNEARKYAPGDR